MAESVLYSQRPEWSDLSPVPQYDGADANGLPPMVGVIAYSNEYRDAMDMLRAVIKANEFSERAFDLTTHILFIAPSHYSVWAFRQTLLGMLTRDGGVPDLSATATATAAASNERSSTGRVSITMPKSGQILTLGDLENELEIVEQLVESSPKCYQLWHHRRLVVDLIASNWCNSNSDSDSFFQELGKREMSFIATALGEDSKNFHAWSYRQWAIERLGTWSQELAFVESMINEDVRNNSAWNQRYYVLAHEASQSTTEGQQQQRFAQLTDDVARSELDYALSKIALAPKNESPWNYIQGLFNRHAPHMLAQLHSHLVTLASEHEQSDHAVAMRRSPHFWTCLADVAQRLAKESTDVTAKKALIEQASSAYDELIDSLDPVRIKYWKFRKSSLSSI